MSATGLRPGTETADPKELRRAVICSTVGNAIEAYDFLIYALMAPLVFPAVFFPAQSPFLGVLLSFSTYFVAFLARPLGAVIFGHLGDKIGRKRTLVATVLLMGIGTVGVGLVPGYATLGASSAVLLVLLRIICGVALGGEWTGATLLAMESGPAARSGFLTSFAQAANPIGMAMATTAILVVSATLPREDLLAWGWRLPFLASAALVALGLWMRLRVHETLEFQRLRAAGALSRHPIMDVFRRQPKVLLACVLIKMGEMVAYYVFTVFVLSYGSGTLAFSQSTLLMAVAGSAVLASVAIPFFGRLGDSIGAARLFRIGSLVTAVFAFAYFPLLTTRNLGLILPLIAVSLLLFGVMFAVEGVILSRVFNPAWRYSGGALAFNLAGIIGAGPAPLVATLLVERGGGPVAVAGYLALTCVISAVAASYLVKQPAA